MKGEFYGINYGQTALESIKVEGPNAGKKPPKGAPPAPEITPTANAIRITGFWRSNPRGSNVIYDILKKLRANPQHLKFEALPWTPASGKTPAKFGTEPVEVPDQNIVKQLESAPAAEEFAAPFVVVIPLSREVPVR